MKNVLLNVLNTKLINIIARSPRQVGIVGTVKLLLAWLFGMRKTEVKLTSIHKAIEIRPGTEDHYVIDKFLDTQSSELYIQNVEYIIDAGAHIGISSLVFSVVFPQATILAIEPNEENYDMLKRNVKSEEQIIPIKGALWSNSGNVEVSTEEESWSHRVRESSDDGSGVRSITVREAMKMICADRVDILKMDIEGSEVEVLSSEDGWAKKVNYIMVEPHPWIDKTSKPSIVSFASENKLSIREYGEDYILKREEHDDGHCRHDE